MVRQFNPANWGYAAANYVAAYLSDCPTIGTLDSLYGDGTAAYWLEVQVTGLFGASSNTEKGVVDGIRTFCQSFSAETKGYTLAEMMLFFSRYKSGRYDNSYASFSARRIGNAFFKEFLPQRNLELEEIERTKSRIAREQRAFTPPEGYTSLSWYNELKRRAEAGDEEARKQLLKP